MAYVKQYVGFLDLLGFKEAVKNASQEEIGGLFALQSDMINFIEKILNKHAPNRKDMKIFAFSDSVIFLYPENCGEAMLQDIMNLQICLASYGWFFRGGIKFGEVSYFNAHNSGIYVYGPAFVYAYSLESDKNKNKYTPAIIFERDTYEEICKESNAKFVSDYIKFDGIKNLYYLDYFKYTDAFYLRHNEIKQEIECNLRKFSNNDDIRRKYVWLAGAFNSALPYVNAQINSYSKINISETLKNYGMGVPQQLRPILY